MCASSGVDGMSGMSDVQSLSAKTGGAIMVSQRVVTLFLVKCEMS